MVQDLGEADIRQLQSQMRAQLHVPYEASELLAKVYATCRVLAVESDERGLSFIEFNNNSKLVACCRILNFKGQF